ncbi:nei like DNA glycosylase 2 [Turdus rufiventris]|nr:nei like DNA glycosylase 2 [Turdus rufiventris]
MPEGPSVRKFQLLTSPFVGQVVVKVGGSSQKLSVNDLNALRLQDSQAKKRICKGDPSSDGNGLDADESHVQGGLMCPLIELVENKSLVWKQPEVLSLEVSKVRFMARTCTWHLWQLKVPLDQLQKRQRCKEGLLVGHTVLPRDSKDRLVLHFENGGFLVFYNCRMLWCSSPRADPASDILSVEFQRGRALRALSAPDPICYTLLDQRYFSGLGNIIKNEILYLARIHPLTPGSLLALSDLERLLDCAIQFSSEWLHNKLCGQRLHPQVYQKEQCPLGHPLMKGTFGPSGGFKRLTWWCPQCQPAVLPGDGDPSPVTE